MPHNSRRKRAIKKLGTLVFESQKPIRIDVPIKPGSQLMVNKFLGYSKGVTYRKPKPVENVHN